MRKMYSKEQLLNIIAEKYGLNIVEYSEEYPEVLELGYILAQLNVAGDANFDGVVSFKNLPTEDPHQQGQLWNDNGTLKISAGE